MKLNMNKTENNLKKCKKKAPTIQIPTRPSSSYREVRDGFNLFYTITGCKVVPPKPKVKFKTTIPKLE